MMVPRRRFIWLSAVILLPAGFAAAWHPGMTGHALVAALILLLAAATDLAVSRNSLKAVNVTLPEVVRLTVDQKGRIQLILGKPANMRARLRLGLALPQPVSSIQNDMHVQLDAGSDRLLLDWPCRALRRGRYSVSGCYLETGSRLGLWDLRRAVTPQCEIRAYPNLVSGQQHLRGLFRRKEWGLRIQRRVGRGREFEQLREYLPGDNFEDIDWKATARRQHPITKVYQVEQAQEIYVLLDASRLSTRSADYISDRRRRRRENQASSDTTIFERFVTASLIMSVVADQLSDRFGLLIFGDKPEGFIKAGRGRAHYNACRDTLYNRLPRTVSPDFDELFTFVGTHLRKRALLVILTSLDDPMLAESFIHAMGAAAHQHILMVNMFRPPGAHPLFTSGHIRQVQGIYQHMVGHMVWASINETQRLLRQHGAALHLLDKHQHCSQLVSQYMEVKQRQVL